MKDREMKNSLDSIAIVGMACRFPGGNTIEKYWENIRTGKECITFFSDTELRTAGVPEYMLKHPDYVRAAAVLEDVDMFDARFFGYSAREAEIMDPQHRIALECAWQAMEDAGQCLDLSTERTGVFMGAGLSTYLIRNLLPNHDVVDAVGGVQLLIHNDKDYLSTAISYKLDLTGPSLGINTACSSSLVAIHLASLHLLSYQCDVALAGGVSIQVPVKQGQLYQPGGIYSSDGHCRAFDARASGTVGGSGVGVIVLKRLTDALENGDHIYATLIGSAVNNDGADKVGYTAPSIHGQASVIREAHAVAGIDPASIGYVEAHGTGTALGDPIEIAALTQAFGTVESARHTCAIGSVKENIGHTDAAAGVAGLIKAALMLKHREIPPAINFEQPNPQINFEASPFYINQELVSWNSGATPRRVGISSFGLGGTNAHILLEEAPVRALQSNDKSIPFQLLPVSAKTLRALGLACAELANFISENRDKKLDDVSYTLRVGRKAFDYRLAIVCRDHDDAVKALRTASLATHSGITRAKIDSNVTFMFPGQGSQYAQMGHELYQYLHRYRNHVDECLALLPSEVRHILNLELGCGADEICKNGEGSCSSEYSQLAVFIVQYALARTLIDWGVRPDFLIGHSLGEYTAACIAGVFTVSDALRLLIERSRLIRRAQPGGMLAVALSENDLMPMLTSELSLGAVNAPDRCTVSGTSEAIETLANDIRQLGGTSIRLPVDRAFHSYLLDPLLDEYREIIRSITLNAPVIPLLSNVTGTWLQDAEAIDSEYWVRHLRNTVRFGDGVATILSDGGAYVEVGPGHALIEFVRRQPCNSISNLLVPTLPSSSDQASELECFLTGVSQLWCSGKDVDLRVVCENQCRQRIPLPTYPFERERYWIDAPHFRSNDSTHFDSNKPSLPAYLSGIYAQAHRAEATMSAVQVQDDPELEWLLNSLCSSGIYDFIQSVGLSLENNSRISKIELENGLGIVRPYHAFFNYMLSVLQDEGILHLEEDIISVIREPNKSASVATLHETLRNRYPQWCGLADFIIHCTRHFGEVLSGRRDGRSVLFPDGSDALMRRCLVDETIDHSRKHIYIHVLKNLLGTLLSHHDGHLRVLEIGAGSGVLTWELAQALSGHHIRYCVTDVSRLFVNELESEAERRGYSHIDFGLFDISKDPLIQGYAQGEFDLIVGLNVAHVASDIRASLQNLKTLLSPGGVLALIETVRPDRWTQIISGMTPDWWSFTDDLRSLSPLLDLDTWDKIFLEQGFASILSLPADKESRSVTDCGLLIACGAAHDSSEKAKLGALQSRQRPDTDNWFFLPSWKRSVLSRQPVSAHVKEGSWLVFLDDEGIGASLVDLLLISGEKVHCVSVGDDFHCERDGRYVIRPESDDDYKALVQALVTENILPTKIVHLWSITRDVAGSESLASIKHALNRGLHSLTALVKALGSRNDAHNCSIVAVTNNAQAVLGDDLYYPGQSALLGLIKVAPLEYPFLACRNIDIDLGSATMVDIDWIVKALRAEVNANVRDPVVAYRGRYRWEQIYEPSSYAASTETPVCLRQNGVYLVTGGLGAIGLHIAEYLAQGLQAKLALLSRSTFPTREHWDAWLQDHSDVDPTSVVIQRLQRMEKRGAEVMILSADVSCASQMEEAVQLIADRYGTINGVIHTAGVVDAAGVIHRRTRGDTDTVLAAKVMGSVILERVLRSYGLDLFVIFSSLGSVLYKLKYGELGYVAASEFQNAYGHYLKQFTDMRAITIDWTDWHGTGMWARALDRLEKQYSVSPTSKTVAHALVPSVRDISPEEWVYSVLLDPSQHWILGGNKRGAASVLPRVAFFDFIYNALIHRLGRCPVRLANVRLHSTLQVQEGNSCNLEVVVSVVGSKYFFKVRSKLSGSGSFWDEHADGEVYLISDPAPAIVDIQDLCQSKNAMKLHDTELYMTAQVHESQQLRWKQSELIGLGVDAILSHLELDTPYTNETIQYPLHPALLDIAVRSACQYLFRDMADDYAPVSYGDVSIWKGLDPSVWSHARKVITHDGESHLIVDILDGGGRLCLSITGCILPSTEANTGVATQSVTFEEMHENTIKIFPKHTAGSPQIDGKTGWTEFKNLVQGVSPAEAIECFRRILHEWPPQVVVCTQDLDAMLEHQRHLTQYEHEAYVERTQKMRQLHQRPELSSEYQAPQTDIEKILIGIWEDILGLTPVGVTDNFFELGGDSLIAIRLIASVRGALEVDLTIASLFEVPTVAQLAERIDTLIWARGQSWDEAVSQDDDYDEMSI